MFKTINNILLLYTIIEIIDTLKIGKQQCIISKSSSKFKSKINIILIEK